MSMEIRTKIKDLRKQQGLTQEELGKKIGVTKATINKYETGIVRNLKRSVIEKLADALETTPAYLMGWDDSELSEKSDSGAVIIDISEDSFTYAMYKEGKELTPEQKQSVLDMVKFLNSQNEGGD